jgi:hypothetical protein
MNPTSNNPSIPGPATVTVVESDGTIVTHAIDAPQTSPIGPISDMAGPSSGEPLPTDKGNFILSAGGVGATATFRDLYCDNSDSNSGTLFAGGAG